ncbi:hypothetical protein ABPG72_011221 [Tetrahymena utriculariae]
MSIVYTTHKIDMNHLGRFGFDLYENEKKLVSAGLDCVFKLYDIQDGDIKHIKTQNCEDAFNLSVNQATNDIYIGYYESKNLIKVNDIDNIDDIIGEEIASFTGPVYNISINNKQKFIGISTIENKGYLIKLNDDGTLTQRYLNDNHIGSCLFTTVDNAGEYALTAGCDGNIKIYNVKNFETSDAIFETQLHVTVTMQIEKEYIMQCSFNEQHQIALGGNQSLQLITRDENGKWILTRIPEINHQRDIQICQWIGEDYKYLITAGIEKDVKIWNFQEKLCIGVTTCEENVCQIRYSKVNNALFIGDTEGNLYRWSDLDFEKMTKIAMANQHTIKQQPIQKNKESIEIAQNQKFSAPQEKSAQSSKEDVTKKQKFYLLMDEENEDIETHTKSSIVSDTKISTEIQEQKIDQKSLKKKNQNLLETLQEQTIKAKELPQVKEKITKNEPTQTPTKEMSTLSINESEQQQKRHKKNLKIQDIIYPSSVSKQLNRSCILWNLVGQIILREEDRNLFLEFDFPDKEFHSRITIKNLHNYSMAAMNRQGFILASKAISSSQEYESEEDFERFDFHQDAYNYSCIYYQSLSKSDKTLWSLKLGQDENAETVAIGDGWCAVQTDLQYIRIYSFSSMEQHCFCIDKPAVCISGYKNILAIVYLDGEPIYGCQSIKLKFFDVHSGEIIKEIGVPLTPFTTLTWFGFSEEGLVLTKDSKGVIRALIGYSNWTPIYEQPHNKNFWLKGMDDYKLAGFLLPKDELEPRLTQIYHEKCFDMQLPLPTGDYFEQNDDYKSMRHNQLILKHEQYRYQNLEQNQKLEEKIKALQKDIDVKVLRLFQHCLKYDEPQKALQIVKNNLINLLYIDSCIQIAQKLKLKQLISDLQQLQQDKKQQSQFIQSIVQAQMKPFQKNLIIVSQSEKDNLKLKNSNKLIISNNKNNGLDSEDDEEDSKGQDDLHEQENNKQNSESKNSSSQKQEQVQNQGEKAIQNLEKKTIGNNPFQKQTKQTVSVEEGLFSANNKKRKDETLLNQKPNESHKKLKF